MTSHCTVEGQSGNFITDPNKINPTVHLMRFWCQHKLDHGDMDDFEQSETVLQLLSCILT